MPPLVPLELVWLIAVYANHARVVRLLCRAARDLRPERSVLHRCWSWMLDEDFSVYGNAGELLLDLYVEIEPCMWGPPDRRLAPGFCLAIVLYRNAEMPRGWTMTGCIWTTLTRATMDDMRAALPAWRALGYDARLELAELTPSAMVLVTLHLRAHAWLRRDQTRGHIVSPCAAILFLAGGYTLTRCRS